MEHLLPYIHNSEEAWANFNLGQEYEAMGQTGAAISFYLRTAERSRTDIDQYEALLRMAVCFEKQKTRDDTEKVILQKAMNLLTDRPEAYFMLSRLHERQKEWHDGYTVACMGLKFSNFDLPPLNTDVGYPGKYGILFEKGVTSWWVGMTEESREIMYDLKMNYKLDPIHANAVENNLRTCGHPKNLSAPVVRREDTPFKTTMPGNEFYSVNNDYMPGVWIIDNFYADPDAVRKFALEQEYQDNHDGEQGYIGRRTKQQFLFPGLKQEFERIMGRSITRWEDHGMNGRFQYAKSGEPLVYHCDDQSWAGMLYLTPNAPYQCGTNTYALKNTDIRHRNHPDIMRCFSPGSRNFDRTPFEMVDSLGNVYNRLVIFNAGYLHSASEYFGFTPENSRLWHMFFFD